MTNIQKYTNPMFGELRIVEIDGEPWFVASDVAKTLGYRDAANMTRNIDEEDKAGTQIVSISSSGIQQARTVAIINESGLYAAILASRLDSAKQFKRWVTSEVLPAIRKHGVYATPAALEMSPEELMARAVLSADATIKRLNAELEVAEAKVVEMAPKVEYHDQVIATENGWAVTEVAKEFGMSAVSFNKLLKELGIQYRLGKRWVLRAEHQDKGYVVNSTHIIDAGDHSFAVGGMKWTQAGRKFLHEKLDDILDFKGNNIL